jgi:hypothetical protein
MLMRRFALTIVALAAAFFQLSAQTPRESYLERYKLLVSKLGVDGVGVETVLNKWAADYPDDTDMLLGKFTYYLSKSRTSEIQKMDASKYLGEAPTFALKDSLGRDVNYFEVVVYDDEVFGKSAQAIDRAIELNPDRLDLRVFKSSALMSYEKESPDMTLSYLKSLVDYDAKSHPAWEYPEVELDKDTFASLIQDFCFSFYRIGTPSAYEGFRELSEKMLSYHPDKLMFMTNLGSYYFVYKHDDKTAMKYYTKVLKKKPDDYATIRNCVLLARNSKNVKMEKKYLPMLIKVTEDPSEKASAEVRLKAL